VISTLPRITPLQWSNYKIKTKATELTEASEGIEAGKGNVWLYGISFHSFPGNLNTAQRAVS